MLSQDILSRASLESVASLTPAQRSKAHVYIDSKRLEPGTQLGPAFEPFIVKRSSALVFVDPTPAADFSHDCQYLLFDADTGALYQTVHARWHPYPQRVSETFELIHALLPQSTHDCLVRGSQPEPEPARIVSEGTRHAILFAGLANIRHLNEIEFCYRMLRRRYGFSPENIHVLHFNGKLGAHGETSDPANFPRWPGNLTPYSVLIDRKGNREQMRETLKCIGSLKAEDLLFLFCTGHGDSSRPKGSEFVQSALTVVDETALYFASDLRDDLSILGNHGSLMVLMQQCRAGGFAKELLSLAHPRAVSFASASAADEDTDPSDCDLWGRFAISWIAAQRGVDPLNHRLVFDVDCNANGAIEMLEAFRYANSPGIRNPSDTPIYCHRGPGARAMTLA